MWEQRAADRIAQRFIKSRYRRQAAEQIVEIVEQWRQEDPNDKDDRKLAYAIATEILETGYRGVPVMETFARTAEQAARRLESAYRRGRLRRVRNPYWRPNGKWVGRGLTQITHKRNYCKGPAREAVMARFGRRSDICADPDLALRPDISAFILVAGMYRGWWTGRKLSHYITKGKCDFFNARWTVNPKDKPSYDPIAKIAHAVLRIIRTERKPRPAYLSDLTDGTWWPQVEEIQRSLRDKGYTEVGAIDGRWGPYTQTAFDAMRRDAGAPMNGKLDGLEALWKIEDRQPAEARRTATVEDLRRMGSTDIKRADHQMATGGILAATGMLGGLSKFSDTVAEAGGSVARVLKLAGDAWPAVVIVAGGVVCYLAWQAWGNRVEKHRTGEYRSR